MKRLLNSQRRAVHAPRCNDQRVSCNRISYCEYVRQEGHTYAHSHLTSANASLVTVLALVTCRQCYSGHGFCWDPFQVAIYYGKEGLINRDNKLPYDTEDHAYISAPTKG